MYKEFGSALQRYIKVLGPEQTRMYCQVKPDNSGYYEKKPLGKHAITKLAKDAAVILNLSNPQKFRLHSLRAHFISTLANDGRVSLAECMHASRHRSAASSAVYQQTSETSEASRMYALNIVTPEKKKVSFDDDDDDDEDYSDMPVLVRRGCDEDESESECEGDDEDDEDTKISEVTLPPASNASTVSSGCTQHDMEMLQEEVQYVQNLKEEVEYKEACVEARADACAHARDVEARAEYRVRSKARTAKPVMSANRRQIANLRTEVRSLRQDLDERENMLEAESLYRQSLEHDHEEEVSSLRMLAPRTPRYTWFGGKSGNGRVWNLPPYK